MRRHFIPQSPSDCLARVENFSSPFINKLTSPFPEILTREWRKFVFPGGGRMMLGRNPALNYRTLFGGRRLTKIFIKRRKGTCLGKRLSLIPFYSTTEEIQIGFFESATELEEGKLEDKNWDKGSVRSIYEVDKCKR